MVRIILCVLISFTLTGAVLAEQREKVEFPQMMQEHMLANMRDHLAAMAEAHRLAAAEQWDSAADIVEMRLGMSSLESHGASHLAEHMPKEMRTMGTEMHRAASRLSRTLQEADPMTILAGFGELMQRCNACHSAFRVH